MRISRLFTDRRFRTKMMVSFLTIAILGSIGGVYGLVVQGHLGAAVDDSYRDDLLPAQGLGSAQLALVDLQAQIVQALTVGGQAYAVELLADSNKEIAAD